MEYYTIRKVHNNQAILDYPILFNSHDQAKSYLSKLMSSDVDYMIIKNCLTQTISNFDNHSTTSSNSDSMCNDDNFNTSKELEGYYIEKSGRGFLLKTYNEHEHLPYFYGKDFDGGWWKSSDKGWFFRKHHLDMLIEKGALAPSNSQHQSKNISDNVHNDVMDIDLSEYYINSYGNGYILRCDLESVDILPFPDSQYLFGKDFDGGWWNSSAKGWFFKPQHLDMLIEKGASLEDINTEVLDLNYYSIKKHGNGYVLFTNEDVEHAPYLFGKEHDGGWWIPKLNGWFFKNCDLSMLQNLGAELVDSENVIEHTNSSSLEESSWSKFKGGYLLKPQKSHPKYGEKYLLGDYKFGGWWNNDECGWFFRPTGWKEYKNKI